MTSNKTILLLSVILTLLVSVPFLFSSCQERGFSKSYKNANSLLLNSDTEETYLKVHLNDGDVMILDEKWKLDTTLNIVFGNGDMFDENRIKTSSGLLTANIDSVALFVTNRKLNEIEVGRIAALTILVSLDVLLSYYCQTTPKACFGSCPTFYIDETKYFHHADAEGFSNAILPSLEYSDIDALGERHINGNDFELTMKNEALETHCLKSLKLLAYPLKTNERVFQTPNDIFYTCTDKHSLTNAQNGTNDITELLIKNDHSEWFSLADEENLCAKEEIILTFKGAKEMSSMGLAASFRQTLMTTYFIYSALGYMGDEIGDVLSKIETDISYKEKLNKGIKKSLGGIDIYLWSSTKQEWTFIDSFNETGPIAINEQIIKLTESNSEDEIKIKIELNKGLWRIDHIALYKISSEVKPIELLPQVLTKNGAIESAVLLDLLDEKKRIISMPGDEFNFSFKLENAESDYELFIQSEGYYIEWMRDNWFKDKDLFKLNQMFENPSKYLSGETYEYKEYEADMERQFWESKIDTQTFSYYEK